MSVDIKSWSSTVLHSQVILLYFKQCSRNTLKKSEQIQQISLKGGKRSVLWEPLSTINSSKDAALSENPYGVWTVGVEVHVNSTVHGNLVR